MTAGTGGQVRLVLFGAPGVGKGTQASMLKQDTGVPHISTGDLLREAMRADTPLGLRIRETVNRGDLVPDDLVNGMLGERLGATDAAAGFILDGYPRTTEQAESLERLLDGKGIYLDAVINIEVPENEIVNRLTWRRICGSCDAIYHLRFGPPQKESVCDSCGGTLKQRADDTEEAIAERLRVYRAQTEPVIAHYRRKNLLFSVDGGGRPEEVAPRIRKVISALAG